MARRVEKPKQNGVYRKAGITTACAGLAGGECACLSGAFSLCWNLDGRLASILESAKEIAATTAFSETRTDAEKLVYLVSRELPDYRTRGLRDAALIVALDIGRIAERIQVKEFEPDVRRGRGTRKAGRKVAKKTPEQVAPRARKSRGTKKTKGQ